ncbi:MAG: GreA/GreB family elongation factor [Chitinophagales bacterium]|nr:GreA/GreB family elongation factor [Chitinophagales bacterium]
MKQKLLNHLLQLVDLQVATIQSQIDTAREAQAAETKSSAGDKYETTREMMTQELEQLTRQLNVALQNKAILQQMPLQPHDAVQQGSLVNTNRGVFYICAPLGKITYEEKVYQVISATSPLGKILMGKAAGEQVVVNGVGYGILSVE